MLHTSDSNIALPSQRVESSLIWKHSALLSTVREIMLLRFLLANARMAIVSDCSYRGAKGGRELLLDAIALEAIVQVGLCGSVIQDLEAPV